MFSLFLDPTMTYSSALFKDPENPVEGLEEAQRRKLRILGEKAGLKPGLHVLEIGCGWGSFALEAALHFGCKVTALTISENQYEYVRSRIEDLGLHGQVNVLFQDYRQTEGRYDAIVSIEMLEAVGHDQHPTYFRTIDRLLKPGGKAAIQVITMNEQRYESYRLERDWIRKYIFPGGLLPSLSRICQVVGKHTSLSVTTVKSLGQHYAPTLAMWRERFNAHSSRLEEMGFRETFQRMWNYYLCICEAGFVCGYIDDLHIVLARPGCTDSALAAGDGSGKGAKNV